MIEADRITLGIFFARTKGQESFTDDSLLYQRILRFSLLGTDHQSFTRWTMCKWLRDNHESFKKRSVESLQPLVARKMEYLMELQLIQAIGTQSISKGTGKTPVYTFHTTSYFLGWLIDSLIPDLVRKNRAINKIYNILWLVLEMDAPSSMNRFLKLLIRKIKQNELFTYVVNYMIELLESGTYMRDISDLINQTLMFGHIDPAFIDKYNALWKETLNDLEPEVKQLVMFRIKLLYEQRMGGRVHDLAQFEKIRFSARERFDKIVLECVCLSCLSIRYEMIDLIEYTIRLRYHIKGLPALEKDCPSCNNTGSLQIIDL